METSIYPSIYQSIDRCIHLISPIHSSHFFLPSFLPSSSLFSLLSSLFSRRHSSHRSVVMAARAAVSFASRYARLVHAAPACSGSGIKAMSLNRTSSDPVLTCRRSFAAKPKKDAKKTGGGVTKEDLRGSMATHETGAVGLNMRKGGTDPPLSLARDDYPLWLWEKLRPRTSLQDLLREARSSPENVNALHESDYRRLRKLKRRAAIKTTNGAA